MNAQPHDHTNAQVNKLFNYGIRFDENDYFCSDLGDGLPSASTLATSQNLSPCERGGTCVTQRKLMGSEEIFDLQHHDIYIIRLSNGKSYKIKL